MMVDALHILFDAACLVRNKAHAPYSQFRVGAALRSEHDQIFIGCNVENAAYPSGTCAEEAAISAMVAGGGRIIAEVVIVANSSSLITPCGACRQRIREFASPQTRIHCANLERVQHSFSINDLLPHSFGPDILKP
jgi:cytidine deaminase